MKRNRLFRNLPTARLRCCGSFECRCRLRGNFGPYLIRNVLWLRLFLSLTGAPFSLSPCPQFLCIFIQLIVKPCPPQLHASNSPKALFAAVFPGKSAPPTDSKALVTLWANPPPTPSFYVETTRTGSGLTLGGPTFWRFGEWAFSTESGGI